jgi:nucleotide-binding universal stress UspA family protein
MRPPVACILVACDLSRAAKEVLAFAAVLAAPIGARLVLMHVIDRRRCPALRWMPKWAGSHHLETFPRAGSISRLRKRRHLELMRIVKETGVDSLDIRRAVTIGKPYAEILAMAKQVKADVILLGTGNAGRKPGDRLGSTAGRILAHSPVPVIMIRLNDHLSGGGRHGPHTASNPP